VPGVSRTAIDMFRGSIYLIRCFCVRIFPGGLLDTMSEFYGQSARTWKVQHMKTSSGILAKGFKNLLTGGLKPALYQDSSMCTGNNVRA